MILSLINRLTGHKRDLRPDPRIMTLTVSDRGFSVTDSHKIHSLDTRWQDLSEVRVIRTDTGPFQDLRFYHVVFDGGEITLPEKTNNMAVFVAHLASLPGFDKAAHDAVMQSDGNNTFSRVFQA